MSIYTDTLESLRLSGNLRSLPAPSGRDVIDLSSNDYLGIGSCAEMLDRFYSNENNRHIALTSSASRLLAADQEQYARLESLLEDLYGRPALIFNSGYHANTGLLSALASEKGTLIVADKLVHASMIDGIVLSRAPFKRFAHADYDRLEQILQREHNSYDRIIVAVESIYSMDGDHADIDRLIELKLRYPRVMLYVDEAHAFGVSGPKGLGLCMASEHSDKVDVIVGTLGKAAASMGAFCITTPELRQYALNRSRSFIFSTALPPLNCAWSRFVIEHMTSMDNQRRHLHSLGTDLFKALAGLELTTGKEPSHIQPIVVGDAKKAIDLSAKLLNEGFKVLPIRTPTVPAGTERLRISLSAALDREDMIRFANALQSSL